MTSNSLRQIFSPCAILCAVLFCACAALESARADSGVLDCLGEFREDRLDDLAFDADSTFDAAAYDATNAAFLDSLGDRFLSGAPKTLDVEAPYAALGAQDVVVRGSVNLPSFKTIQFWGNMYSGSGEIEPNGWGNREVQGNYTGASVGLNLPLGAATLSGFYNYHRDHEFFTPGRVEQKDNSGGASLYLNSGGFYFALAGLYGVDKYTAKGRGGRRSFDGSQSSGYFETGYEMMAGGMFVLKPFGSYHYSNVRHEGFDAQTWSRESGKDKYNSCKLTLGSRIDLNLAGLDSFTLQGRMAWTTELRDKTESMRTFSYGRVPGTFSPASPYFVGEGGGSDTFWGGAGLRLSLLGMLACSVDYDCLFNKRQTNHIGSLSLLFGF